MTRFPTALSLALAAFMIIPCGCENAGQGALSGAGIGALSGLAIGSMTGSAGEGAAIGAIVGGVGGAVVGDQNRRRSDEASQQRAATRAAAAPPPPPPPPPPPAQPPTVIVQQPPPTVIVQQAPPPPPANERFQTGPALTQLIGSWAITGTIDSGSGNMIPVSGSARSIIDDRYFVSIDLAFLDPRNNQNVTGTIIISQTGGWGLEMTSSFSSHPQVRRYRGEMDATGSVLNFTQTSPPDPSRRIVMRLSPGRVWTADVWNGNQRIESFTFTWIGP